MTSDLSRHILTALSNTNPTVSRRIQAILLAISILVLTGLLGFRSIEDLDYGIHLGTGRWILEHGTVPLNDPFTWSIPDHRYIAYHWGFQLILAWLYELMGHLGPVLLRLVLVCCTAITLVAIMRVRDINPLVGGVCGLLTLIASEWRFAVRPELFSNLFVVLTILILDYRRVGSTRALWALPVLLVAWVNTHVYALGFIVLGSVIIEQAILRRLDIRLLGIMALSIMATFLNPYGSDAVLEPLRLLTRMDKQNIFAQNISELVSPLSELPALVGLGEARQDPFQPVNQLGCWLALLLLSVPAVRELLRERRIADALMIVIFGALACSAIRNTSLFSIATLPAISLGLTRVVSRHTEKLQGWLRWIFPILACTVLILTIRVSTGAWYAQQRRNTHLRPIVERATLALDAAEFVERNQLSGRGFNNFNVGGTLIFGAPSHKIFIDGRNEVTGEEFFQSYLKILEPSRFDSFVQARGIEYLVLAHAHAMQLIRHLLSSEVWTLAHYDPVAVVFVRKGGPNGHLPPQPLPAPIATPEERWTYLQSIHIQPAMIDRFERWLFGGEEVPIATDRIGTFLLTAGLWTAAERPLIASAQQAPHFWETSHNLGALYTRLQQWDAATFAYRTVLMLNPSNSLAQERSETNLLRMGLLQTERVAP